MNSSDCNSKEIRLCMETILGPSQTRSGWKFSTPEGAHQWNQRLVYPGWYKYFKHCLWLCSRGRLCSKCLRLRPTRWQVRNNNFSWRMGCIFDEVWQGWCATMGAPNGNHIRRRELWFVNRREWQCLSTDKDWRKHGGEQSGVGGHSFDASRQHRNYSLDRSIWDRWYWISSDIRRSCGCRLGWGRVHHRCNKWCFHKLQQFG